MVAGADLLDAHHAYLLGNFQHALRILQKIKDKELQLKVDVLTYRVYLAQKKYGIVLDEIREDSEHIELRFIRLIATFLTSTNARERVLREAEKLLTGTLGEDAEPILVLAATLYLNADLPELALRTLHPGEGVYCSALRVQCFMAMNRYDLAGKEVRRMQTADEDALPCQLATALFNLSKGGEQLQEALNIYEELKERYGATSVILNGQAAALIGMNKWEEAESILQEALDADNSNPEVLVNSIMVSQHLGKPIETINRLTSQLRDANKDHQFLLDYSLKEEEFNRCAQQFAPSVPS